MYIIKGIMVMIYVLLMGMAIYHRNKDTYIYFKTLTSITFVITGVYYGYQNHNWVLIPTLIGFLIGDIMLATRLRRSFIYGMGGFFLGDVWLLYYLYQWKRVTPYDFILSIFVVVFVTLISKNPKMHLGHYKKPMYGYGIVLSLAVSNSIGCYFLYGTWNYFCLAAGMVLYFISDFLLMFQYFYRTEHRDRLKLAKMYTYFIGVYLIACSIGG